MNRGDLRTRCQLKIPNIKTSGVTPDALNSLINEAVEQVNLLAKVYRGYTDFNIVANQAQYQLSIIAPTFQQMVTAGLWVRNSSTGKLLRVIPRTVEWFNKRLPTWRDATPTNISQYYYREGDDLMLYPAMNANQVAGGRIHHTFIPATMNQDSNFPFSGTDKEITSFQPLDRAIVEYVRCELDPSLNQITGEEMRYPSFVNLVNLGMRQIKAKGDAMNYYDVGMSYSQ